MRYPSNHGYFEFNQFPGCAQLIVSNHSWIAPQKRGQGFGQEQQLGKLNLAAHLGYNCIICTVDKRNSVEKHILKKNGWKYAHTFFNTETGKYIEIHIRDI